MRGITQCSRGSAQLSPELAFPGADLEEIFGMDSEMLQGWLKAVGEYLVVIINREIVAFKRVEEPYTPGWNDADELSYISGAILSMVYNTMAKISNGKRVNFYIVHLLAVSFQGLYEGVCDLVQEPDEEEAVEHNVKKQTKPNGRERRSQKRKARLLRRTNRRR